VPLLIATVVVVGGVVLITALLVLLRRRSRAGKNRPAQPPAPPKPVGPDDWAADSCPGVAYQDSDDHKGPELRQAQFTVYRPKVVRPDAWYPLLAFTHLAERRPEAPPGEPDPIELVRTQARQILGARAAEFRDVTADARQAIPGGAEMTLLPHVPGVVFNPERRVFRWIEDVHREEFRLCAAAALAGTTVHGRLLVFLGVVLVGEVTLAVRVDAAGVVTPPQPAQVDTARPYRRIFASYAHADVDIVRRYEQFVETLGDRYLRDVRDLRSGEDWDEALLRLIDQADVFQLFWSHNAMNSPFVRREWEYALSLNRAAFIRPTYWEVPLPQSADGSLPPAALRRLHFHRIARRLPVPETAEWEILVGETEGKVVPLPVPPPSARPLPEAGRGTPTRAAPRGRRLVWPLLTVMLVAVAGPVFLLMITHPAGPSRDALENGPPLGATGSGRVRPTEKLELDRLLMSGKAALHDRRYDDALRDAEDALRLFPEDAEALALKAEVQSARDRDVAAIVARTAVQIHVAVRDALQPR